MWHDARVLDVALVDCLDLPVPDVDREVLLEALTRAGLRAAWWSWDDGATDWTGTGLAVVRSPWNYSGQLDAFLDWVDRTEAATTLLNPPSIIRWNAHKSYLLDLAAAGVAVVPTHLARVGEWRVAGDAVAAAGWSELVVKPAVGVGAIGAFRVPAGALAPTVPPPDVDVLVQPFVPSITTRGETSVVVFDGAVSHAVCKVPATGDYRVHEQYGGQVQPVPPSEAELELVARSLDAAGDDLLYARVDLVEWDGAPHVMELELIEPSLFLALDNGAADRFARAIAARAAVV